MDFNDTHEEAKFRKKCREWLEKNATYKDDLTPQNDDFANADKIQTAKAYQAIKHKLADMYIALTLAKSNCYYAAWALSTNAADLPSASATARVSATKAFQLCSKENIQTHGGNGFTWEYDCHMFYRRSKLLSLNIGSLSNWREKLVTSLEQSNIN